MFDLDDTSAFVLRGLVHEQDPGPGRFGRRRCTHRRDRVAARMVRGGAETSAPRRDAGVSSSSRCAAVRVLHGVAVVDPDGAGRARPGRGASRRPRRSRCPRPQGRPSAARPSISPATPAPTPFVSRSLPPEPSPAPTTSTSARAPPRSSRRHQALYHLRLDDFSVRNGPDLYVYLSPEVDDYAKGALEVGKLKATDGAFGYDLPSGTDPADFASAIIWCKQFSHLFAVAPFGAV